MFGVGSSQHNRLIASQPIGFVDGMGVLTGVLRMALGSNDEKGSRLIEGEQSLEGQIPSIHDIEGSRLWQKDIENIDVVKLAVRDMDKGRNIAA